MKRLLLILTLLFLTALPAWSVVTYDTASSTSGTDTNQLQWSHTAGSGCANPVAVVGVSDYWEPTNNAVSSVSYGATSLTHLGTGQLDNETYGWRTELWGAPGITTGSAQTVTVTMAGIVGILEVGVTTLCDAAQTSTFGAVTSAPPIETNPTVSVSSQAGDMVVDQLLSWDSLTASGSQSTNWQEALAGGGGFDEFGASSRKAEATSMTWIGPAHFDAYSLIAVPVHQYVAASSRRPARMVIFP